jgi:hypothetical protein
MSHTVRQGFGRFLAVFALSSLAIPVAAAQRPAGQAGRPGEQIVQPPVALSDEQNADQTRERLYQLLENYPPTLGRVLKLDPSLLKNPEYLAPYPSLATFLGQHPEVAHNPDYFLERVRIDRSTSLDPRATAREQLNDLLAGFASFLVFLVVTGVLIWLIRMIVTHRRWNRMSKVQFETHAKLLDRFTSNEDLMAYIQTPAGRRFLESAPIPLQDEAPRAIAAPLSRILWSVQAGVVLAIAGLGLLYVSSQFIDELSHFFMVIGVLTIALGAGFIMSAVAAYVLSRRLGLLEPPATTHA